MIMPRIHLFEFMDQSWYPETFRRMQADYLQFVASRGDGYQEILPKIQTALKQAHTSRIIDLCSGSSGPWVIVQPKLAEAGTDVRVTLTDKFPHPVTVTQWSADKDASIEYWPEPVDALAVPKELSGMRTLFEGFHHFKPEQALEILRDAVDQNAPIGIFEASLKPPWGPLILILSPVLTILAYLLITPLIKPRNLSRFIWTYLIPIVPLTTCWDGVVSLLRVYSPDELNHLIGQLPDNNFTWEVGLASTKTPFTYTYLVGYPA